MEEAKKEEVPFLPTLHTFAMNNIFTGSVGASGSGRCRMW